MIIAIDFDGTCVTHAFPKIGEDIGAVPVLKALVAKGHKLILYTMRSHTDGKEHAHSKKGIPITTDTLNDAVEWFLSNGIPLFGVNNNPTQKNWTSSPKIYAHLYIDDAALGIPLKCDSSLSERPFADWNQIESILKEKEIL